MGFNIHVDILGHDGEKWSVSYCNISIWIQRVEKSQNRVNGNGKNAHTGLPRKMPSTKTRWKKESSN